MTYPKFPKIPRLNRDIIVTEKIDGSNGQIFITKTPLGPEKMSLPDVEPVVRIEDTYIYAGSRSRWLGAGASQSDNFGFARWVLGNAEALVETLGEGTHWGEWWGSGIQRGYGYRNGEKFFSLFNTSRWEAADLSAVPNLRSVPVLWTGNMKRFEQEQWLQILVNQGSFAAPGFMAPEGLVVFHTASNHTYKVTLIDDERSKSEIIGKQSGHGNDLRSEPIDNTW